MLEKCSVVGLGKLGLPLAVILAEHFPTIGVDRNSELVDRINDHVAAIPEPGLQELLDKSSLRATTDTAAEIARAINDSDVTFIIVPTPSLSDGNFDNQYVLEAVTKIGAAIAKKASYHLVSITSTVMPGSTRGVIKEALETAANRKLGDNLGLTYNPEFIALGDVINGIKKPDMVLIGEPCPGSIDGDLLQELYTKVCVGEHQVARTEFENAEMAKIALNTFLTIKIAFANMVGEMCHALPQANAAEVMRIVGYDSRISPKFLMPGTGFGGPCLPRDGVAMRALFRSLLGKSVEQEITIFDAIKDMNAYHVDWIVDKITSRAQPGSTIGILGLSYKPGTDVTDGSTGIALAIKLCKQGFAVQAFDPLVTQPLHADFLASGTVIVPKLSDCVEFSEILIVTTPCKEFLALKAIDNARQEFPDVVFDCWRMFKPGELGNARVVHIGKNEQSMSSGNRAVLQVE